jgi:hypothetical protein
MTNMAIARGFEVMLAGAKVKYSWSNRVYL